MELIQLTEQARAAVTELLGAAKLSPGDLFVVGCSSSEVGGEKIGSHSSPEIAQCCEHLNRALIVEEEALRAYRLDRVNVVPQPKAGGSFATAAWAAFRHPAAVERIGCAAAGIDIGQTLIGMHLRPVAVPVRLSVRKIGEAPISCARTRPKFVGGSRAVYDPALL